MNIELPERGRFFGKHFREITAGEFACTVSRATVPKEELPEHSHEEAHFILAIDPGYLSRALDEPGRGLDLIYNPPGTVHRDCFFEPGGRYLGIAAPAEIAPPLDAPLHLASRDGRAIAARALGLCVRPSDSSLALENLLLELLAEVAQPASLDPAPSWLRDADELIESVATCQDASVAGLARRLELHPVYFARAYRAARGFGPARAIRTRRVEAAVGMLCRDIRLAEIASACGFADQSHLCRSVSRWCGAPPSTLQMAFP